MILLVLSWLGPEICIPYCLGIGLETQAAQTKSFVNKSTLKGFQGK